MKWNDIPPLAPCRGCGKTLRANHAHYREDQCGATHHEFDHCSICDTPLVLSKRGEPMHATEPWECWNLDVMVYPGDSDPDEDEELTAE